MYIPAGSQEVVDGYNDAKDTAEALNVGQTMNRCQNSIISQVKRYKKENMLLVFIFMFQRKDQCLRQNFFQMNDTKGEMHLKQHSSRLYSCD